MPAVSPYPTLQNQCSGLDYDLVWVSLASPNEVRNGQTYELTDWSGYFLHITCFDF